MDRATLVALLVGAGITLVTTIVTTVGAELFREWRTERRARKERRRAVLEELQDALNRVNGQVVLHLELPTTAKHAPPFAQFLSSSSQDFARIDSLETRV